MAGDSNRTSSDDPTNGTDAIEQAFSVLGDETRLRILLELVDATNILHPDRGLTFSELRERVGAKDSGRFNYHLGKLEGTFIEKVDEVYVSRYPARAIISAVYAGTFRDSDETDARSMELDRTCPNCSHPITLRYEEHTLTSGCENCNIKDRFERVPPGAFTDRTLEELAATVSKRWLTEIDLARQGVCLYCWGETERTYPAEPPETTEMNEQLYVATNCQQCWYRAVTPLRTIVGLHPLICSELLSVDATRDDAIRKLYSQNTCDCEVTLHDTDPVSATMRVETADRTLSISIDGDCRVTDIEYR